MKRRAKRKRAAMTSDLPEEDAGTAKRGKWEEDVQVLQSLKEYVNRQPWQDCILKGVELAEEMQVSWEYVNQQADAASSLIHQCRAELEELERENERLHQEIREGEATFLENWKKLVADALKGKTERTVRENQFYYAAGFSEQLDKEKAKFDKRLTAAEKSRDEAVKHNEFLKRCPCRRNKS